MLAAGDLRDKQNDAEGCVGSAVMRADWSEGAGGREKEELEGRKY